MMRASPHCLRLILEFEGVRLTAYQCSAQKWTIGVGCTEWEDGRPVREHDTITEERVEPLLRANLERFERCVNEAMAGINITQHQFDAMVVSAFNTGQKSFMGSGIVSAMKQKRPDLAAASFESVTGSTSFAVHKEARGKPEFTPLVGVSGKGAPVWVGRDGRIGVGYMRRLEGLLRRHLATSLLFVGHDWTHACASVRLVVSPPSENIWDPNWNEGVGRWKERTVAATTHADVLANSKPLADADDVPWIEDPTPWPEPPPDWVPRFDDDMDIPAGVPDPVIILPGPFTYDEETPVKPDLPAPPAQTPTPAPVYRAPIYIPSGEIGTEPKDMVRSRRFWGLFLILIGRLGSVFGLGSGFTTAVTDPVVAELVTPFLILGGSYTVERVGEYVQHLGRRNAKTVLQ